MALKDELLEVIRQATQESEQEEKEGADFERQLKDFRKAVVVGLFREAEETLKATKIGGEFHQPNGSIALEAGSDHQNRRYRHSLKLSPDKAKRLVVCASSFEDAPETFTLDALTAEIVTDQIKQFVYAVAGGKRTAGLSVYDERLRRGEDILLTI